MSARPVPRNIDKPNRNAEFALSFLVTYYGLMFLFRDPLVAFASACGAVYAVNRLTIDKPEGQAFRFVYQYVRFGRMVPPPRYVRKFEV